MGHNLSLSIREIQLLQNALSAISRTGGSTPSYHLSRKLSEITGVEPEDHEAFKMQLTAVQELREAGAL